MQHDIAATTIAYAVTVASFSAWIFVGKPERIPRTRRTVFALCLRSVPLFAVFFMVCQWLNVATAYALLFLTAFGFVTLTGLGPTALPGLAFFWVIQQWILAWPDRELMVNNSSLDSDSGKSQLPNSLLGRSARTSTPLRPTGKVIVDGKEFDASCEFGFLDAGVDVAIVGMGSFNLLVEARESTVDIPSGDQGHP